MAKTLWGVLLGALLLAAAANAAEPIRLPNRPALSPDGKTVAFDWNNDIWSVPTTGGVARMLTSSPTKETSPKFSPDGKKIAFVSDRTGSAQVFIMPANGGVPVQATFNTAGYSLLEWTPDGKGLLVGSIRDGAYGRNSGARMYIVPLSDDPAKRPSEKMVFDDYGANGALSPDGKGLLFNREGVEWWRKGYVGSAAGQVWLYRFDDKSFTNLVGDGFNDLWPLWKPDGKGFYYVSGANKTYNLVESNGKEGRPITKYTDDGVAFPCIARDTGTIVYRQLFDLYKIEPGKEEAPSKIEILRDDDRAPDRTLRKTLTTAEDVAFTADGLEVAFIAGGDVWVMDTELKEPKRITKTPEEERSVTFSPDGKAILFVSDAGGKSEIVKATRGDDKKPWMLNNEFKLENVTDVGDVRGGLEFSPDGSKLGYIRGLGKLYVADADGKNAKLAIDHWNVPSYDWSPDAKWIVYSLPDNDFNSDVWVKPLDDSRKPFNISRHPYMDGNPVWSPDGKVIAWVGAREKKDNFDIHYVFLQKEDDEKSSREKTLEKAVEKLQKGRSPLGPLMKKDPDPKEAGKTEEKKAFTPPAKKAVTPAIDFDGIYDRVHRVSIPNSTERGLFFSPDGKKLGFAGTSDGSSGTFTIEIPDNLRPTSLSSSTAQGAKWLKNGSVVGLVSGVPGTLPSASAAPAAPTAPAAGPGPGRGRAGLGLPGAGAAGPASSGSYRFTAYQDIDLPKKHQAAFDMAWRVMRDQWYDSRLGNRDWNAVRAKYLPVAETPDIDALQVVIQMMLGELNGSHLGFFAGGMPLPGAAPSPEAGGAGWRENTAHLGARFDPNFPGPGWKVKDTLPNTPADQKKTKLNPGDVVLAVDGKVIDNAIDPTVYLNGNTYRDITLKVRDDKGTEREVVIRPTTMPFVRSGNALYQKMIHDNMAAVDKLSDGKLGYLHIKAMDEGSFVKFEEALYNAGAGKEGLVIDVRENGGGSTADLLLTALTQPKHAIAVPRGGGPGYPQDRTVFATWTKPIVVLCNQNSFSNAEIFSHAVKINNRGHLVGVPTAGGVISTGATSIMDVGTLRLPFRGWFKSDDGEDQELNGAVPHFLVWPKPGDMVKGKDDQLEKAVKILAEDVQNEKAKPKPTLRKATERK